MNGSNNPFPHLQQIQHVMRHPAYLMNDPRMLTSMYIPGFNQLPPPQLLFPGISYPPLPTPPPLFPLPVSCPPTLDLHSNQAKNATQNKSNVQPTKKTVKIASDRIPLPVSCPSTLDLHSNQANNETQNKSNVQPTKKTVKIASDRTLVENLGSQFPSRRLVLHHLREGVEEEYLRHDLSLFGCLEDLKIERNGDYNSATGNTWAFVVYHNVRHAISAKNFLHGKTVGEETYHVRFGELMLSNKLWMGWNSDNPVPKHLIESKFRKLIEEAMKKFQTPNDQTKSSSNETIKKPDIVLDLETERTYAQITLESVKIAEYVLFRLRNDWWDGRKILLDYATAACQITSDIHRHGEKLDAMRFQPTLRMYQDPEKYMKRMRQLGASKCGIAVIEEPEGLPSLKFDEKTKLQANRKIQVQLQKATKIADGVYVMEFAKGETTLQKMSRSNKGDTLYDPQVHAPANNWDLFWRNLPATTRQRHYAPDMDYEEDKNAEKDGRWDISRLPGNLLSILLKLFLDWGQDPKECLKGVATPSVFIGAFGTVFVWHKEDLDLQSIFVLKFGKSKIWYAIPPMYNKKFETAAEKLFFANGYPDDFCEQFLRHKQYIITPEKLDELKIPYVMVEQKPGDIIVTYESAYHCGFNTGENYGIAVNYATKHWIAYAKHALQNYCDHKGKDGGQKFDFSMLAKIFESETYDDWMNGWEISALPEEPMNYRVLRQKDFWRPLDDDEACVKNDDSESNEQAVVVPENAENGIGGKRKSTRCRKPTTKKPKSQ